ncbi:methyltransferase [Actinomycetospora sp. TBRC 11914]|uniref:methyltransferase n=1 Tax=Actinomycetospora sp. TBRC 11914 TaxID=2729387 RepID=UPI00145F043A|nr:methyltransferase [Actinomycetospora sp. TBRC 11914]NMO91551.1 methyltransferase [Actinomycetospora sp. TBRC 11914]
MAQGYQLSQALYVAAELGVADALAAGPLDAHALAGAVGARADELARVVRALVTSGVFTETDDGAFALNDAAACLRRDAPGDTRAIVVDFGTEMYHAFGELLHTVRTGQPGFEALYGQPLFDHYTAHPDAEARGSARMRARSLLVAQDLAAAPLFDEAGIVVDVGGGIGTVLTAVLQAHPALSGVLYERTPVARLAGPYLAEHGLDDRCRIVEGDFFAQVPDGGDVYLLKSVLHDWDDDRCRTVLARCRAAMSPHARLVIVEIVLPDHTTDDPDLVPGALLDLIMLVYAGGRERTRSEFAGLLDATGFRLHGTTPLPSGPHLIEAHAR